jgi:hypothetical protein
MVAEDEAATTTDIAPRDVATLLMSGIADPHYHILWTRIGLSPTVLFWIGIAKAIQIDTTMTKPFQRTTHLTGLLV